MSTTNLKDARFIRQTFKNAITPIKCPLGCGGAWIRDLTATKEKYLCDGCATRWVRALDIPRYHRPQEES